MRSSGAWRRVGKAEVEVEVDADMVRDWRRRRRRSRRSRRSRRRIATVIKSNNPHLAGGEKHILMMSRVGMGKRI